MLSNQNKLPSINSLDLPNYQPFYSFHNPVNLNSLNSTHLQVPYHPPSPMSDSASRSRSISDPLYHKLNYLPTTSHPSTHSISPVNGPVSPVHAPIVTQPVSPLNLPTPVTPPSSQVQVSPVCMATSPSPTLSEDENSTRKTWKPRKKRQCPECKLFFSNLATHKSTHLKPTNRPHVCKYCQRGFARPNDLFRHIKCHWKEIGSDKGQFKCPFKRLNGVGNEADGNVAASSDNCCHNTGIFSRCDTFKNHLKAIHFQYPNGTKKDQRGKVPGVCRMCQLEFANVDDWLVNHIEKNDCKFQINLMTR